MRDRAEGRTESQRAKSWRSRGGVARAEGQEALCARRALGDGGRRCQEPRRGRTRQSRSGVASRSELATRRACEATFVKQRMAHVCGEGPGGATGSGRRCRGLQGRMQAAKKRKTWERSEGTEKGPEGTQEGSEAWEPRSEEAEHEASRGGECGRIQLARGADILGQSRGPGREAGEMQPRQTQADKRPSPPWVPRRSGQGF